MNFVSKFRIILVVKSFLRVWKSIPMPVTKSFIHGRNIYWGHAVCHVHVSKLPNRKFVSVMYRSTCFSELLIAFLKISFVILYQWKTVYYCSFPLLWIFMRLNTFLYVYWTCDICSFFFLNNLLICPLFYWSFYYWFVRTLYLLLHHLSDIIIFE